MPQFPSALSPCILKFEISPFRMCNNYIMSTCEQMVNVYVCVCSASDGSIDARRRRRRQQTNRRYKQLNELKIARSFEKLRRMWMWKENGPNHRNIVCLCLSRLANIESRKKKNKNLDHNQHNEARRNYTVSNASTNTIPMFRRRIYTFTLDRWVMGDAQQVAAHTMKYILW